MTLRWNRRLWWALLALVVYAFTFVGARGLWEPDEGRYTAIALRMLRSGDFIIPGFNAEQPHLTKPPLTYWAIAGSLSLFGRHTWAARLPSALAFVGTVLLVVLLGRRLVPARPWLPGLLYALTLLPAAGACVVNTDTLLTFWTTLAGLGYVAAFHSADRGRGGRWIVVMWVAFGMAFLTKGPPGLLFLAALAVFALLARGRVRLPRVFSPLGLALFAAIAFGWFLLVAARMPGLIERLLHTEVYERVAGGHERRNAAWYGALVIYVPTLLVGTFPWTGMLLRALPQVKGLLRRSTWRQAVDRDPGEVLLLLWVLVPLAVFVIARSRLSFYLLPLFVPLALLAARGLEPGLERRGRRPRLALVGWALFLIAARGASAWVPSHENARVYATAVSRSVATPFQEIVFIDTRPHYGLSLYLDVPIEKVTLGPGRVWEGGPGREQGLAEELAETQARLFIVPERHREEFLGQATSLGFLPRYWGRRDDETFYTLERAGPSTAP